MNPFAAHQKREKDKHDLANLAEKAKEKEEMDRAAACRAAIEKVLDDHNCELHPVVHYLQVGVVPDLQIVAKDKQPDEPRPGQSTGAGEDAKSPKQGEAGQ